MITLKTPLTKEDILKLKCGDMVLLSGTIYTARDAAHQRIITMLEQNEKIPMPLKGAIIYYAGPTPTKENHVIGSIGPTTSCRMDSFMEPLAKNGLLATIGKGNRDPQVKVLCKEYQMVYFLATGGIGALLARQVVSAETIAFDDLGCEAIRKLEVKDFPLIVGYDAYGNSCLKE